MNEVKNSVVFFSLLFGIVSTAIAILMGIEFCSYERIIDDLEQRIEEQSMLIELLGDVDDE